MNHRVNVLEYSTPKVDVETGVIRGVKIIGLKSTNGYTYQVDALRNARTLYEQAPVFILHPDPREAKNRERKMKDHFGSLQNVRERGFGGQMTGLFGDLHVKLSHPLAASVLENASTAGFGLSHNAEIAMNDDASEVLEIIGVNSVDLVDSPATTKNLFEENDMSTETGEFPVQEVADLVAAAVLESMGQKKAKQERNLLGDGERGQTRKSARLTALEARTNDQGSAEPIGNTHEDFMGALRGFPVTNK